MGGVRPLVVVEGNLGPDASLGLRAGLPSVQVDEFVIKRPPEPFDYPIVDPATTTVHRDLHLGVQQHLGELRAVNCER